MNRVPTPPFPERLRGARIGLDARPVFTAEPTGVGAYIQHLAVYLASHDVRVSLFTNATEPAPSWLRSDSMAIVAAPGASRYRWEWFKLPGLLRKNAVDLFHATWNWGLPRTTTPTVLTVHDLIPLALRHRYRNGLRETLEHEIYTRALGAAVQRSIAILTDSNSSRSDLVRWFPRSVEKTIVVPAAAEPSQASHGHPTMGDARPYLLYFGGFERRKNVESLLRAFPTIHAQHPDLHLVLVGAKNAYFHAHLETLSSPGVHFTGYLERPTLDRYIAESELVVYPSRYEGFGLPVLEAMREGKVVVTTDGSSLREFGSDSAVLLDPPSVENIAAAVLHALGNPMERHRREERARQIAQEYSWERTAAMIAQVYDRVLTGGTRS